MNGTKRALIITAMATIGLVACGDDNDSPGPAVTTPGPTGTEAMVDTTEVMVDDMTPTTGG